MILVDTGPIVALFDPKDPDHDRCRGILEKLEEPLYTTVPVLTEVFHLLGPGSIGSARVRDFIAGGGLLVWFLDPDSVARAFALMDRYADHPMDLADASLVTAAELCRTRKVFTIDRDDFSAYRVRRGHRHYEFEIVS